MFLMPVISLLRVFLQAFTDLNFICAHHKVAAGHLWAKFLIMSYYLAYVYFFISIFFLLLRHVPKQKQCLELW